MATTTTIIGRRLARFNKEIKLCRYRGTGVNSKKADVCAMQAADWLAGGDGRNTTPECVCPVIRQFVIGLNDGQAFYSHLDLLKPFVPKILGTQGSLTTMIKRAKICARYATQISKDAANATDAAANATDAAAKYAVNTSDHNSYQEAFNNCWMTSKHSTHAINYAAWRNEKQKEIREACLQCLAEMIAVTD